MSDRERFVSRDEALDVLAETCARVEELERENERLKATILAFGNNPSGFDWAVLGRIEELETENRELRETMRTAAASLGSAGGKARAKKLTPERRAEIARTAARARWGGGVEIGPDGPTIIPGEDLTGKMEPCCECGEDYPKADLVIRGEVFCPKCREKA